MPSGRTSDFTFRYDRSGNMITGKRSEYVINIVKMLFNLKKGDDPYNPDRGLFIQDKIRQQYVENQRDTAYETEIVKQFTTYTDLIPVNVVAIYMNKSIHIYMSISYQKQIYELDIDGTDTLTAMLRQSQ